MIKNNTEPQLIFNGQTASLKNKSNNKFILLYLSLIIVLTFIAYSNSLKNDFINGRDDNVQVLNNYDIKDLSIHNIKKIFTNYYDFMYQPLTFLSFALEYKFFTLNPKPYHIDNLMLHLLNIILVFSLFIY
jgi:protein O-mannosyl-transferase